jgi:hypothetical protein
VVAVGGAAGGLGRYVASRMGMECTVPEGAEIISSIGDALSMVRAERERTVESLTADMVRELCDDAEAEAMSAGAAAGSVEVRFEELPDRGTARATATGTIGDAHASLPGQQLADRHHIAAREGDTAVISSVGSFWLVDRRGAISIIDRFADPVATVKGERCAAGDLAATVERLTRYRGPATLRPMIWSINGSRLAELGGDDMIGVATSLHDSDPDTAVLLVGRKV